MKKTIMIAALLLLAATANVAAVHAEGDSVDTTKARDLRTEIKQLEAKVERYGKDGYTVKANSDCANDTFAAEPSPECKIRFVDLLAEKRKELDAIEHRK